MPKQTTVIEFSDKEVREILIERARQHISPAKNVEATDFPNLRDGRMDFRVEFSSDESA